MEKGLNAFVDQMFDCTQKILGSPNHKFDPKTPTRSEDNSARSTSPRFSDLNKLSDALCESKELFESGKSFRLSRINADKPWVPKFNWSTTPLPTTDALYYDAFKKETVTLSELTKRIKKGPGIDRLF